MLVTEKVYDIRFTGPDDIRVLKEWLGNKDIMLWYPPSTIHEAHTMAQNWIGFYKYKASLTALYDEKPVGIATLFLMPYKKVAHISMMYMIVDPQFQRKGIGYSLLKNIIHYAKKFNLESIHLEVYEGSPIIPLLKKFDFQEVIKQEDFVHFPDGMRSRLIYEKTIKV